MREKLIGWAIGLGLFSISGIFLFFFINGVYCAFWNVPNKNAIIAEQELIITDYEKAVAEYRESIKIYKEVVDKYQTANNLENLLMLFLDPQQIIDMRALDKWLADKKDFHKKRKFSYKKDSKK